MKEKLKENLNVIIFSIVNFLVGLTCLLIIKNPVPISIAKRFIVGELGNKWILLLFLFLGLLLGGVGLIGKQTSAEHVLFARKRQIGINVLITLWTVIVYFFLCLFTSMDIIGSRVMLNIASMAVCVVACVLALFAKNIFGKKQEDTYLNYRLSLTIFVSEICGYVLLVVSAVNIFVDHLLFILPFVVVCGLVIYLVPMLCTKNLKKKQQEMQKQETEEIMASDEKILNAVNFASDMISEKATSKKSKSKEEPEKPEEKPVELAEEVVRSKKQTKKLERRTQTKKSQNSGGNKSSAKSSTSKPKSKQSAKKQTKSSSNYKGTSKTKNIKK